MKFVIIVLKSLNLSRQKKLKIENLNYFDFDYKSERNKFIINIKRHIYYRDIFV